MRKWGVVTGPIVVGALVLASCGSDAASGATASTIDLDSEATNYIVKDPVTTTIEPPAEEVDGITEGSQVYIVQSGDYAIKVADQFGVPLEDLLNFNGWATGSEFPFPGEEVKIPPGGKTAGAATEPATADQPEVAADPVGDTIPEVGSNCAAGKHTVVANDLPIRLADQYDVTLDALAAANANNPAYNTFIPGQEIIIPAKPDC
jgi:LysM repeat protein